MPCGSLYQANLLSLEDGTDGKVKIYACRLLKVVVSNPVTRRGIAKKGGGSSILEECNRARATVSPSAVEPRHSKVPYPPSFLSDRVLKGFPSQCYCQISS